MSIICTEPASPTRRWIGFCMLWGEVGWVEITSALCWSMPSVSPHFSLTTSSIVGT